MLNEGCKSLLSRLETYLTSKPSDISISNVFRGCLFVCPIHHRHLLRLRKCARDKLFRAFFCRCHVREWAVCCFDEIFLPYILLCLLALVACAPTSQEQPSDNLDSTAAQSPQSFSQTGGISATGDLESLSRTSRRPSVLLQQLFAAKKSRLQRQCPIPDA